MTLKTILSLAMMFVLAAGVATAQNNAKRSAAAKKQDTITTMSGLRYIEYELGKGAPVSAGMKVKVDYAGYLLDGTLFDTSLDSVGKAHQYDRGGYGFTPIEFTVGIGQVIRGWDEGLTTNMKVGGRRRLIIPSDLAYGDRGAGAAIPPGATLVFDVHMLDATGKVTAPAPTAATQSDPLGGEQPAKKKAKSSKKKR